MNTLPSTHFLSLARPDPTTLLAYDIDNGFDSTTLAAHDFDVDNRTGFLPPDAPIQRLSGVWGDIWETCLDRAIEARLQLGDRPSIGDEDVDRSMVWRRSVRQMPVLDDIKDLKQSEVMLRRAHTVLAWIMHFYIHTLPPSEPVLIPRSITIPLLRVSAQLQLPPVLTYSDTTLYNWSLKKPSGEATPALDNLQSNTLFTGTIDEQEFYLSSVRIELRGVEALELMRATMDEVFVGDDIALGRITTYLHRLAVVIKDMERLLMAVKVHCKPETFYRDIRPWFRGVDSTSNEMKRKWVFEGVGEDGCVDLMQPKELSGPSAGQSALIHALDVFLGVDQSDSSSKPSSFLDRMRTYMPRYHRSFLTHLSTNPRPLRTLVSSTNDENGAPLREAYNTAVGALKKFRDAHMIIVALFIVGPARRAEKEGVGKKTIESAAVRDEEEEKGPLKGTGGTDLIKFLKDVRSRTVSAMVIDGGQ